MRAEVEADAGVFAAAVGLARSRLGNGSAPELEACSFQLLRAYNVLEQLSLRIAKACENHIDDERGWHTELMRRLTLAIPGVRPPFFPADAMPDLQEVRGFRHVIVHAYDLELRREKLTPVLGAAERLAQKLPAWVPTFFDRLPGH